VPFDNQFGVVGKFLRLQSVAKALPASFGIADFQGAADQSDAAPAPSCQAEYRLIGSLIVIGDHSVSSQLRIGAHPQNEWDVHLLNHLAHSGTEVFGSFREQDPVYSLRQ